MSGELADNHELQIWTDSAASCLLAFRAVEGHAHEVRGNTMPRGRVKACPAKMCRINL